MTGTPHSPQAHNSLDDGSQQRRWNAIYAGDEYYYGDEPGPVARRAVTYHRHAVATAGTAFDAGCGEGQDLAFLAQQGYDATGLEFTSSGAAKTRRLLNQRGLRAMVAEADLRDYEFTHRYDLVIAVNVLQFLGEAASQSLDRVIEAVAPGGVLGLSLFAPGGRDHTEVFTLTLPDLLARFSYAAGRGEWRMIEAAQLWQWHPRTAQSLPVDQAQEFVTLIAQRVSC